MNTIEKQIYQLQSNVNIIENCLVKVRESIIAIKAEIERHKNQLPEPEDYEKPDLEIIEQDDLPF